MGRKPTGSSIRAPAGLFPAAAEPAPPGALDAASPAPRAVEISRRAALRRAASAVAAASIAASSRAWLPAEEERRPDFTETARALRSAVEEGAFPGAVAAVGSSEGLLWIEAFGHLDAARSAAATPDTIYDLASLTKVVGTTSVVICLIRDGKLRLEDAVSKHVSGFLDRAPTEEDRERRASVRIEHLLAHCAGLDAWRPFWRSVKSCEELLEAILAAPLAAPPGEATRYSDLGFILLGEAAARAGGAPLEELERRLVLEPLRMRETLRNPPRELRERIAPTEREAEPPPPAPVAGAEKPGAEEGGEAEAGDPGGTEGDPPAAAAETFVHGVVHDENARAAGGRTGHAGLFSTAGDLARLAAEILRGLRGESRVFPREILERFTRRRGLVEGSSRALGWDTPSAGSSAGEVLSPDAFGHTGFTGTSIWLDPRRDIFLILLSNRVHPTRANLRIGAVRRSFADSAAQAVDAARGGPPRPAPPEDRGPEAAERRGPAAPETRGGTAGPGL